MRYSSKISIPILCPIRFEDVELTDEMRFYPKAFNYMQKWTTSDPIHVQIQHENTGKTLTLRQRYTDGTFYDKTFTETVLSANNYIYDAITYSPKNGVCWFEIWDGSSLLCDSKLGEIDGMIVGLCKVDDLFGSASITYWNPSNDYNVRFGEFQTTNLFTYRVEGGFIPSKLTPKNNMKRFTDSMAQDTVGYSNPFSERVLSLGGSAGIPWWIVEQINFIFACDVTLIQNTQWQISGDISVEETAFMRETITIPVKRKTNLYNQNYGGTIYITDKYGSLIQAFDTGELKNLIL